MSLEIKVVLVITILVFGATYITGDMLQVDMDSEFVIVKKVLFAELTVWMQKDNIAEFVHVSAF